MHEGKGVAWTTGGSSWCGLASLFFWHGTEHPTVDITIPDQHGHSGGLVNRLSHSNGIMKDRIQGFPIIFERFCPDFPHSSILFTSRFPFFMGLSAFRLPKSPFPSVCQGLTVSYLDRKEEAYELVRKVGGWDGDWFSRPGGFLSHGGTPFHNPWIGFSMVLNGLVWGNFITESPHDQKMMGKYQWSPVFSQTNQSININIPPYETPPMDGPEEVKHLRCMGLK